ncbi:MAG: hypothetical protein QN144_12195, partial [Armatimonadota bacterium]|nr:hypothetical protein [Armatimonadota bacterium]
AGRPIVAESKWLEAGRALIPGKGIVGRLKHVAFGSLMAQDAWLTAASARAEYMRLAERRILAERLVREAVHGVDDANLAARLSEVAAEIRTLSPSVADDIARALVSSPDASALRATLTRKIAPDRAPDIRRLELLAAPRVDLVEEAREAARRLTWNNDPPLFVADMFRAIDAAPPPLRFLARQVFKYVKVPVNITMSFFGDYALAPAKFIKSVADRNPEKAADAAARSLVAYGMFGVGWVLSSLGMVDGPGPKDPNLRAAWMSAGHVPNTLRIGNWHISLSGLQPFSYYFIIPAAIRERLEEARATGKQVDEDFIVRGLQMLFRNVILDSSVMASMANIYDAIASELSTPGKLGQAIGGIITGAIPRILAVAAREMDPLEREIFRSGDSMQDALINQVLYSIPGAREKLPPRLGIFGETVKKGHVPLSPFIRTVERAGDPVAEELFRLGLTVSRPPASVEVAGERVQVPPEVQRLQQIARGTLVRRYLERLIRSPEYAALSDEQKRQVLRAAIRYATPTDLMRQLRETGGAGLTEERLRQSMGVVQP